MKYLFIFLTLPFFLIANQDIYILYDREKMEIIPLDYWNYDLELNDGHFFKYDFEKDRWTHSEMCPCIEISW